MQRVDATGMSHEFYPLHSDQDVAPETTDNVKVQGHIQAHQLKTNLKQSINMPQSKHANNRQHSTVLLTVQLSTGKLHTTSSCDDKMPCNNTS
jgi:hypothetical protein